MKLTDRQQELLKTLIDRGGKSEMFAQSRPVVNSLKKRGLITERFIGQRWSLLAITEQGRDAIRRK